MRILFSFILLFFISYCVSVPDISKYSSLKEPVVVKKSTQKVLTIQLEGDPNKTVQIGFGRLYGMVYKLKSNDLSKDQMIPRARWPKPFDIPMNQFVGIMAVPVSNSTEFIPEDIDNPEPKVKLETWYNDLEYAEILHIGSYEKENPTIEKLKEFIKSKGYKIVGTHEEEYIKGPGMIFKGNPEDYQTIIRYEVQKEESAKKK